MELTVKGMSCGHCTSTVKRNLEEQGYQNVNVDLTTGKVSFEKVDEQKLKQAIDLINSLGYEVINN